MPINVFETKLDIQVKHTKNQSMQIKVANQTLDVPFRGYLPLIALQDLAPLAKEKIIELNILSELPVDHILGVNLEDFLLKKGKSISTCGGFIVKGKTVAQELSKEEAKENLKSILELQKQNKAFADGLAEGGEEKIVKEAEKTTETPTEAKEAVTEATEVKNDKKTTKTSESKK